MAGIAYGISVLAVGAGEAPRRARQPQSQSSPTTHDQNNSNPTPSEEFAYLNSGKQHVKGLTNQTGYVKGNANGTINFGTLRTSARQP
ncbi:uncharacterized protein LOC114176616 [Vigna unguiculata]|uniref:Uncharacterized protein n=1 Tax=Vigna unguiculata TaxID=3917 RepID=A0A4D6KZZ7_VIGUN|nr:uncharacterized protein LOC114176616 [Vigna unguiculata]QCD80054.1 hypothetical protein DEO72_LG2g373 [Vigna unguiculata]